ncbi:hypothetical protein A3H65_01100 [Candidatus Giovannonibacteria bacterium RIFCSPLOWO2_02_FULL_45_14]|uniref:Uncharacterized protein n=1 Tax=Candidatus Giovannonibacteria bacterium RIFCSPLOWO2_12_FULL_44_15 TaxID=1798364 RepID=A0A1F5XZZ7_9BACT|nr:MAG: hypothetical protein A3C75_01525 [Candidatus Giovannonibacteria bacterium RIFCSPHIGHO2_02_FULL_44_31]OGF90937.1 MAG: hypothetical protein A3H65_01100 [Candidatus Giovannonibacteria bacterium RIFCSPLOWO2_02_FULL_45_14]OGF93456.1 MAG: hypothetical protein A3G54_04170 [Candidatus Giovannonibacteria bacterium RIFCSPLOWO2_12_FULL_44_15]
MVQSEYGVFFFIIQRTKNFPPKKNLKLSSVRRSRELRGDFLATKGGEIGSDYLKNTAPESHF